MHSLWLSFVPRHVAEDILLHPEAGPIGREQRFEAVALFADVSGFTAMSEALGKAGRSGTEELTTILNTYFGRMIDLIESYGGITGKFGGDALTVLFPYTRRTQAPSARRAIQCALDMQANMHRYASIPTSAGPFSLAMKAGLAMGPVLCTTVGDPLIRLEYIIGGQVLDRCADAEHHAGKGEVVVDNELLRHAGAVDIAEERGAFSWVARLKRRATRAPLGQLPALGPAAVTTLACYLHPAIARRVAAEQSGFINEHRKVTVLFARFDGFDYDADPNAGARLQCYLSAVIEIVQRYDGYLNKVDMGDKGSKYIVLFGAPVAHENDEERALRCALELSALRDTPARIGVNTGLVYAGQIGAAARQEYTVIGDPVNLAARLMQACRPGQIVVSGFTHGRVAQDFTWEHLDPIKVKGKAGMVPVHLVRGSAGHSLVHLQEPTYLLPMVGREIELRQASDTIDRVRAGQGQIVGITAEAGMGKSRLNAEIITLATRRGLAGHGGACQSYGTNISYLVWHDIWRSFFGIDPAVPLPDQMRHLEAELASIDPQFVPRLPLLQAALHISIPDNELTQSLDPQLRTELLRSLLLECLRRRARTTPILLVLEDVHWIDPLSGDLLEFIGRNLGDLPVLLIGLYRPHEGEQGLLERMAQFAHATEIRLTEFTPEEALQLISLKLEQHWGMDGISPALAERITAKAQGNPFYIEEMINYIRDRGIDLQESAVLETLDLPDSLHGLIISRIDQLAEDEKTMLRVRQRITCPISSGLLA